MVAEAAVVVEGRGRWWRRRRGRRQCSGAGTTGAVVGAAVGVRAVPAGVGVGLPFGPSVGAGAAEPGPAEGLGAGVCACPREDCAGAGAVGAGSVCEGSADGVGVTTGGGRVAGVCCSCLFWSTEYLRIIRTVPLSMTSASGPVGSLAQISPSRVKTSKSAAAGDTWMACRKPPLAAYTSRRPLPSAT